MQAKRLGELAKGQIKKGGVVQSVNGGDIYVIVSISRELIRGKLLNGKQFSGEILELSPTMFVTIEDSFKWQQIYPGRYRSIVEP